MKITALLTGRGNSTLKDKNVLDILGKPALYYISNSAKQSKYINDFYCSSDDEKILKAAKQLGYKEIVRPKEFAQPTSQHSECIFHALDVIKADNEMPDILVVLLANNVSAKSKWIDDCISIILKDLTISAVVPVYEDNDHHPLRAKKLLENGTLGTWEKEYDTISSNRQDLPRCLFLAHNFWVLNVKRILKEKNGQPPWTFMGNNIVPYMISDSVDIHSEKDLFIAKFWIDKNYTD